MSRSIVDKCLSCVLEKVWRNLSALRLAGLLHTAVQGQLQTLDDPFQVDSKSTFWVGSFRPASPEGQFLIGACEVVLSNLKDIPVRHAASQRQRYCTPGNLEDGPARSIEKLEEEICELGQQLADERKEVAIAANRRKTRTKRKVRQETQDFFGDLAEDVVAAVVQYVHKLGDAESNKFLSFFDANEPAINVSRLLRQAFLEYLDSAHDNELTTFVEKVQALEQQITLLQEANASLGRKLEDLRARTFADIRS